MVHAPNRFSSAAIECGIFTLAAALILVLLPLWAVVAFVLQPVLLVAAIVAVVVGGVAATAPRRRHADTTPRPH